jgi:hypothetical protein
MPIRGLPQLDVYAAPLFDERSTSGARLLLPKQLCVSKPCWVSKRKGYETPASLKLEDLHRAINRAGATAIDLWHIGDS